MQENKYDDPEFFTRYSAMTRSVQGLTGAGEWPALQKLLPEFRGRRVLDLGCGFGWHCRYAAEHGAASVVGTDLSAKMLEQARQKNALPPIVYRRQAIEDMDDPPGSFDVVISSLAFHYVASFAAVCRRVRDWLTPGGDFVFSVEHPVFTAAGAQDWHYGADGAPQHWPVDRYFDEGPRQAVFLGEQVMKYHRTLTTYLHDLLQTGFVVKAVVEPMPDEALRVVMPDEMRRPMMLLVAAQKSS